MMCPTCCVVNLSEIQLKLRNADVRLRACVRCEQRWWDRDGEPAGLDEVLGLIRSPVAIHV